MSKQEILTQLSRLSPLERREIARLILDLEDEAAVLRESDQRAEERFLMLDALEAGHEQTPTA